MSDGPDTKTAKRLEIDRSLDHFWLQGTLDAYEVIELTACQFTRLLPEIRRVANAPSQIKPIDLDPE